jgi:hypothetical protein
LLSGIKENVIPSAIAGLLAVSLFAQVTFIRGDISGLRTEMGQQRTELKAEISGLRTELKGEIAELRTELKGDIAELRNDLKALTEIVTRLRLDMAKYLPAPSSQSTSDQDSERPRHSDNPAGGGAPAQGAPAPPGGTPPPSR